jgi:hypothetical protein
MMKYPSCPQNPTVCNLLKIESVLVKYCDSPTEALKMWRCENFTRFNLDKIREKYPKIVLDKVLEMAEYFKENGINSTHLVLPVSDVKVSKYSRARMPITDHEGKRIGTEVSCASKYPKPLNGRELQYNRKVNASQGMKQYNYKVR